MGCRVDGVLLAAQITFLEREPRTVTFLFPALEESGTLPTVGPSRLMQTPGSQQMQGYIPLLENVTEEPFGGSHVIRN